jgi:hypothetical protein
LFSIVSLKSCLFIKPGWFLSDLINAPRTNILIERVSTIEHPLHILDGAGVPVANILIERLSTLEHPLHILDAAGVPVANILIERLSLIEHHSHIFDSAGVNIREVKFGDACSNVIFGEGTLCKIVFLEFTISKQSTTIGREQSSRSLTL